MTEVRMTPSTLRRGAVSCRRVARNGAAVARQVKGHAPPDLVPADVMSAVHDACNQLQRSAIAAERQAIFLDACAHKGLLADGPFGLLTAIGLPRLLSPWPAGGVKHKGWLEKEMADALRAVEKAVVDEVQSITGVSDIAIALLAVMGDEAFPGITKLIPGLTKRKEQFEMGVRWAMAHPDRFLEEIGKDTIAYNKWAKGDYAGAIASNLTGLASAFFKVARFGKYMHDASTAGKVERQAAAFAKARHELAGQLKSEGDVLRPQGGGGAGTGSAKLFDVKQTAARWADENAQRAHDKSAEAHKHKMVAGKELAKELMDKAGSGGATALTDPPKEAQQKDRAP
jgi:hypothetical protein